MERRKPLRRPLSCVPKPCSGGPEQNLTAGHNHFTSQVLSSLQPDWKSHLRDSNRLRTRGPLVIPPKPGKPCPDTQIQPQVRWPHTWERKRHGAGHALAGPALIPRSLGLGQGLAGPVTHVLPFPRGALSVDSQVPKVLPWPLPPLWGLLQTAPSPGFSRPCGRGWEPESWATTVQLAVWVPW